MMVMLMYMCFMIPICLFNFNIVYQIYMVICLLYFMHMYSNSFMVLISYYFGIDNVSYLLICLCLYVGCLMILSSMFIINSLLGGLFIFINLVLQLVLIMMFSSLSMMYMYMYFEFSLIPLVILILGWGYQPERLMSSIYLIFYTLFGSLPLLIYMLYLNYVVGSLYFIYVFYVILEVNFISQMMIMLSFLIKFPMFMFHFWLPSAHVQAPISGSMILAGLMLKVGGYGLLRFLHMMDYMFINYSYIWLSISLYGVIFVSLVCLIQVDMSSLIAYSSVNHMGMCMMSMLTMSKLGVFGSIIIMLSHGLCSSGLFCLVNMYYSRTLSRSLYLNKGLIYFMPSMSLMMFMFCCFNMGCPPSFGYLGELSIMMSLLCYYSSLSIYLIFIIFLGGCFSIYLYSITQHGCFINYYSYSMLNLLDYLLIFLHLYPLIYVNFILMKFI